MEEWWKAIVDGKRRGGTEKILTILTRIRSVEQKNKVFFYRYYLCVYILHNTADYKIVNVFFSNLLQKSDGKFFLFNG